jgi:hypothetical protein
MRRFNRMTCVATHVRAIALTGLLAMAAVVGAGCTSSFSCAAVARASLQIVVNDTSGKRVCNAKVTVRDGSFESVLRPVSCLYYGPTERAGTYSVEAQSGARVGKRESIKVSKDHCGVKPVDVIVTLSS